MPKQKIIFEDLVEELLDELEQREKSPAIKQESLHRINEFIKRRDPVRHPEKYIARQIRGLTEFKRLVALASISPFHPIHSIAVGDPSVGKTEVGLSFQEVTPQVTFSWGSKLSGPGLTLARLGNEVKVGVLPRSHMGLSIIDEFSLLPASEASAVLSTMQNSFFGIDKAFLKVEHVPARCSILAMCNPSGDYWTSSNPHAIKRQMPLSSMALLTRFHFVWVMLRPSVEEFDEISAHQLRYIAGSRKNISFDDQERKLWNDAVIYLRHLRVGWGSKMGLKRELISSFTTEVYRQDRKGELAIPASPRLNEGLTRLAEAFAKAGLHNEIWVADILKAIQMMANSLVPCGLDLDAARRRIAQVLKHE